jgi:hypothetical protein
MTFLIGCQDVLPEEILGVECAVGVRREANILNPCSRICCPAILLSDSKFVSRYAKQSHALTVIKSQGRFALSLFASQILIFPRVTPGVLRGSEEVFETYICSYLSFPSVLPF